MKPNRLNIAEAIKRVRENAAKRRNRAKCRKYYYKRRKKDGDNDD